MLLAATATCYVLVASITCHAACWKLQVQEVRSLVGFAAMSNLSWQNEQLHCPVRFGGLAGTTCHAACCKLQVQELRSLVAFTAMPNLSWQNEQLVPRNVGKPQRAPKGLQRVTRNFQKKIAGSFRKPQEAPGSTPRKHRLCG